MDYFQSGSNNPQVLYIASIDSLETYNVAFFAEVTDQGVIVTQSEGVKPLDKDFELWLVRSDGQVLTLGVLSAPLNPEGLDIPADSKFAISVEPIGGSPTGVATGPVVALGALTRV
jgi:anti-sigma-K factor RskA